MSKEKLQKKQQDKINQMISFIDQEASEKAREIDDQTNQDCTIEKNERVETAKHKLREEYEAKNKQVEVDKRM
jgi:V-type H+-transporting ATPase subunit E